MLTDPNEIEIVSKAIQAGIRNPKRSRIPFHRIFETYLVGKIQKGGRYLDLGPGHWDFGELVRQRGGECVGIDFDPAVVELGRHKGFQAIEMNLKQLSSSVIGTFDGVFNKFSFDAFWFIEEEAKHENFVKAHADLLTLKGWAWLAPWNGIFSKQQGAHRKQDSRVVLDLQKKLFTDYGFKVEEITIEQSKYFGIHGAVENNVIFTRNLKRR